MYKLDDLADLWLVFKHWRYMRRCSTTRTADMMQMKIIKACHSIERGLALADPHPGFGAAKVESLIQLVAEYMECPENLQDETVYMACAVLNRYFAFNDCNQYTDANLRKNKDAYTHVFPEHERICPELGGVQEYVPTLNDLAYASLKQCIETRHSIRQFKNEPVDEDDLQKAIALALKCPSACNRQATRVYILGKEKISSIHQFLGGTQGFLESVDKILIITGKCSGYELTEAYQYIVSSSIFVGYLSLTLHALCLGACILQRPLQRIKNWAKLAKTLQIPQDEQMVCMIAVGVPQDHMQVPISHRLPYDSLVKTL